MNSTVTMKWLLARLYENDIIIVDCRFQLGNSQAGKEAYEASHLPRAIYMDLEQDLSSPVLKHGGRHPLPNMEAFIDELGKRGIRSDSRVIAYDDQGGAMASRLWWLLKYVGHEHVYVMEQGFTAWQNTGYPVTQDPAPVAIPGSYAAQLQPDMLVSMEEVREQLNQAHTVLIDSREAIRFAGKQEPIDPVAGHIPGARNFFWKEVLKEDGTWKSEQELRELFSDIDAASTIIVYCGSGVTACPNVIALQSAGFPNVKLYAGSWSDWISYRDNPVATGEGKWV
ncbi:sulfurtransferase [Marinicrinis sediminis]|uniref:Sulfurtransferase n=1 Tax=Marinicrinis sediminis TaxID=1652465 RepID=A0ABW5R5K9_9BACL